MSEPLQDPNAERVVLGAILVDNKHLTTVEELLKPDHFSQPMNRDVFQAMVGMGETGQPIDLVSLKSELGKRGDAAYIAGLIDGLPNFEDVTHWAGIVRDKARRRAAKVLGERLVQAAEGEERTEEILDRHATALTRLIEAGDIKSTIGIDVAAARAMANIDRFTQGHEVNGIPTGLPDVDRLFGGFQAGTLVIIAARPGQGKSILCAQTSLYASKRGAPGLVFSMEMPPEAMVERMLYAEASVEKWDLRFNDASWPKISMGYAKVKELPLWFDQRESPTMSQIRANAKRQHAVHGIKFVIVDYLQRVDIDSKQDNWVAVGETAKGLKSLARMLNIPVIVACQLNRESEGKAPGLKDLAESGKIEREADVVIFLDPDKESVCTEAGATNVNLIVGKHRAGGTSAFRLRFQKSYCRFVQLSQDGSAVVLPEDERTVSNWKGQV